MSDWFRKQPKLAAARSPARPAAGPGPSMPPLPVTPRPWAASTMPTQLPEDRQGISAKVVMHHFARGEVRSLDKEADALHGRLVEKLRMQPEFYLMTDAQLAAAIQQMTYKLQSFDLTINFRAKAWFEKPNPYTTYTQMYERGARRIAAANGASEVRLVGGHMNPVASRDVADTKVSFGPNVAAPGMQGVARFMQTGGVRKAGDHDASQAFVVANNQFNPRAKPIFAGLNIGQRPHGANTAYGMCHLVLKDHFKKAAIYYMGDTFLPGMDHTRRVTHGTLLALILNAQGHDVLGQIIDAAYRGMVLKDTAAPLHLAEAHIYDQIAFRNSVKEIVVSSWEIAHAVNQYKLSMDDGPHPTVQDYENNAKIFAHRNQVAIRFID